MKIYIEGKEERPVLSQNNYIEKTIDDVVNSLTDLRNNLDSTDEAGIGLYLIQCKNWLNCLIVDLTDSGE